MFMCGAFDHADICVVNADGSGLVKLTDSSEVDWSPFRAGDPPLPTCTVHVIRRIDVATGRLARACTPEGRVRAVSFVRLPERFRLWQVDRGLPQPPSEATACACDPDCRLLDGESSAPCTTPKVRPFRPAMEPTAIDPTLRATTGAALEAIARGMEITWRTAARSGEEIHRLFCRPRPGLTSSRYGGFRARLPRACESHRRSSDERLSPGRLALGLAGC
jgi:hypothetical protein